MFGVIVVGLRWSSSDTMGFWGRPDVHVPTGFEVRIMGNIRPQIFTKFAHKVTLMLKIYQI